MDTDVQNNAVALTVQLQWLSKVIETRFALFFKNNGEFENIEAVPMPDVTGNSAFDDIVKKYQMDIPERVTLLMALVPHLQPQLFDIFYPKNANIDRRFTEFGGKKGQSHPGFIPTGETVAFVLAGDDVYQRLQLQQQFSADHFFSRSGILKLADAAPGEPVLSGALQLSAACLSLLTTGQSSKPDYGPSFPAKLISTNLAWSDLVVAHDILNEITVIQAWITHGDTLMNDWGLAKKIRPGYRSLFYGPPGIGKTLTAALLGKNAGLDVYRVDLPIIVSKYIGETETNLANIFDLAQNQNWILFFDETDALFGKRTAVTAADNRYLNPAMAYLMQRIADHPGIVIFAANVKPNLGDALGRLFQSAIYFAMPDVAERTSLWKQSFGDPVKAEPLLTQKLPEIATTYELTGGAIINVLRYAALMAVKNGSDKISYKDVIAGINRELTNEGKKIGIK